MLSETRGNSVVSPLSAAGALTVVGLGARGETRDTVARSMGVGSDLGPFARELRSARHRWSRIEPSRCVLATGLEITRPDLISDGFRARILQELGTQTTVLAGSEDVLAAARIAAQVELSAPWLEPFEPIGDGPFRPADGVPILVPRMASVQSIRHWEDEQTTAVSIQTDSLDEGQPSLLTTLLIPREGASLADVEERWAGAEMPWLTAGRQVSARLVLPTFELTGARLDACSWLNTHPGSPCEDDADLSTLSRYARTLKIERVDVESRVRFDPYAVTASSSAVAMVTIRIGTPPQEVVVDHPFLFLIHDQAGVLLFAGRLVDPSRAPLSEDPAAGPTPATASPSPQ